MPQLPPFGRLPFTTRRSVARWTLLGGLTLITVAIGAFVYHRWQAMPVDEHQDINVTPAALSGYTSAPRYRRNPYRYNFGLG